MESMIKGVQVILYEPLETGKDAFQQPVYTEVAVTVENVLITPAGDADPVSETQLHGKHIVYELSIPKVDAHTWEDRTVEFFGQKWRTIGFVTQFPSYLVPLDWDRKIKVERFG